MVLQDTWLFGGTIAENIAYGADALRPGQVVRRPPRPRTSTAFVRTLPDGYDTVIDEEGSNVSAGEKQLITIARAFLAEPSILILDEATSSVDTRTEVLIQRAMNSLRSGPDQLRHRAPALHHPRRRRDPGDGERQHRRAGHARRADRGGRRVRPAVLGPVRPGGRPRSTETGAGGRGGISRARRAGTRSGLSRPRRARTSSSGATAGSPTTWPSTDSSTNTGSGSARSSRAAANPCSAPRASPPSSRPAAPRSPPVSSS